MFLFSSGNYLLLNNWNIGENGDAAQIVSPVLQNAGVACLSFKLYLAKISSGTLSVYQRLLPSMELVLLSEEAKKSSTTPSEWKTVMITLRNSKSFQVGKLSSYYFMNIYNAMSSYVSMHSNRLRRLPLLKIVVLFFPESELHCDKFQYLWMYMYFCATCHLIDAYFLI